MSNIFYTFIEKTPLFIFTNSDEGNMRIECYNYEGIMKIFIGKEVFWFKKENAKDIARALLEMADQDE